MTPTRPPRRAFAPLALAALALGACQTTPATPEAPHDAAHTAAPPSAAPYTDARFLREMTAHHRMALDMTRMATATDAGPDVKRMAAAMEAAQTREVAEMDALLRAMGEAPDTTGAAGMAHGAAGHMGMPLTMDELRAARPFDRAFLAGMIGHHAAAVTMAAEAVARSTNADVQRLARAVIRDQAREIAEMQARLDAEYPGPSAAVAPADSGAAR